MKNYLNWILGSLLLVSSAFGAAKKPVITIYNSNLGLVQEEQSLTLKKGRQTVAITDVAAKIQPATVHLDVGENQGFQLLEQNFQYDLVNSEKVFDKYLGNQVTLISDNDESLFGTLLARDGSSLILRNDDGSIRIVNTGNIKQYIFPELPEGLIVQPTLQWILDVRRAGTYPVSLRYLTEGMSWNAEYILQLGQNEKDHGVLSSWVTLQNNSGTTFADATIKLVAGNIHRAGQQEKGPIPQQLSLQRAQAAPVSERQLFEYHLYQIGFPTTLNQNSMKQVVLREPAEITYQRIYTFEHRERESAKQENVRVAISFRNTKENNLGIPLPAGVVRMMQEDVDGAEVLVGEDQINHTPADEEVRLTAGTAFDIVGSRQIVNYERRGNSSERWTVDIDLRNHKESAVTVTVLDQYYGDWEILSESMTSERPNATTVRYEVKVPAQGEAKIQYTVERHL